MSTASDRTFLALERFGHSENRHSNSSLVLM